MKKIMLYNCLALMLITQAQAAKPEEKAATPQWVLDLTSQLKAAKGDSEKSDKVADQIDAAFEKGTYKFSEPTVMHLVFGAFDCSASEKLYTNLATRLVTELESNPRGVLDSALVVQCHHLGKSENKFFLTKMIACVLKDRASAFEHIDGALEHSWSRFAPFKGDPLAQSREKLLKKVNEVISLQLDNISKGDVAQYHCKLDNEKKKNQLKVIVIEFQKALNKYIPISRDAAAQVSPSTKDAHD